MNQSVKSVSHSSPCVHIIHHRLKSSRQLKAISENPNCDPRGLNDQPLRLTIQHAIREGHGEQQEVLQKSENSLMKSKPDNKMKS